MSQTRDKRRRADLDLFVLALIESGLSSPYDFQKAAGLSPGATIPALQRLLESGSSGRASRDRAVEPIIGSHPPGKSFSKPAGAV